MSQDWLQDFQQGKLDNKPDTNWPKISIVTPSYNQGEFIEETILSVINQNYPNLEYIIIDGGSTDNTIEIIRKYEQHISYWVSEPDEGQSHGIEKGLEKCSGEFFNWLNSDDYLEAGALKKIVEHFLYNEVDVVCTASHKVMNGKKISIHPQTYQGKSLLVNIGWATRLNQQGMFYRLDILRRLGGINRTLQYCMDFEIWIKYLLRYGNKEVLFSDEVLSYFRIHQASKTQQYDKADDDNSLFRNEYNSIYLYLAKKSCKFSIVKLIKSFSTKVIDSYVMDLSFESLSLSFIRKSVYFYLYAQLSYYLHRGQLKKACHILLVLYITRPFDLMNYKLVYAVSRYQIKGLFKV